MRLSKKAVAFTLLGVGVLSLAIYIGVQPKTTNPELRDLLSSIAPNVSSTNNSVMQVTLGGGIPREYVLITEYKMNLRQRDLDAVVMARLTGKGWSRSYDPATKSNTWSLTNWAYSVSVSPDASDPQKSTLVVMDSSKPYTFTQVVTTAIVRNVFHLK